MLVDGKKLAEKILNAVQRNVALLPTTPTLAAVTCAPNFETKKYLEMKKRRAAAAGISLNVLELPEDITTEEAITTVKRMAAECDGVVVQLPLPAHLDKNSVLTAVPAGKDPDGFLYGIDPAACVPPVVAAIDEISKQYSLSWEGKRVVIVGEGKLVGLPARIYAKQRSSDVISMNADTFDPTVLATADIIVTGVGKPNLITPDMVKVGVWVFDAGTSEDGGQLVGDVTPDVASIASIFTPVPGGIGPLTIACLLQNLVSLAKLQQETDSTKTKV